jgi:hypothetical protein
MSAGLTVCIVFEKRRDGKGEKSLFGVYADEAAARRGYGDEVETYEPEFVTVGIAP